MMGGMALQKLTTSGRYGGGWQKAYLAALAKDGNVSAACRAAKVSRQAAYNTRRDDEAFRKAWDTALEDFVDGLELTAVKRARKRSDKLLIVLLGAHRPEKYARRLHIKQSGSLDLNHDSALARAVLHDPAAAELAGQLLERMAPRLRDAGGTGVPGESGPVDSGQAPPPAQPETP